jgi:hypothetical protein
VTRFQFYSCSNAEDDTVHRLSISGDIKSFQHNAGRIIIILTSGGKQMKICFDFPIVPKHRSIEFSDCFQYSDHSSFNARNTAMSFSSQCVTRSSAHSASHAPQLTVRHTLFPLKHIFEIRCHKEDI